MKIKKKIERKGDASWQRQKIQKEKRENPKEWEGNFRDSERCSLAKSTVSCLTTDKVQTDFIFSLTVLLTPHEH